jgi:hypothetical protein
MRSRSGIHHFPFAGEGCNASFSGARPRSGYQRHFALEPSGHGIRLRLAYFWLAFSWFPGSMNSPSCKSTNIHRDAQERGFGPRCRGGRGRGWGRPVPAPSARLNRKWIQRVPKSLHARIAAKAEKEGVSLNTLVASLIPEGPGRRAKGLPGECRFIVDLILSRGRTARW